MALDLMHTKNDKDKYFIKQSKDMEMTPKKMEFICKTLKTDRVDMIAGKNCVMYFPVGQKSENVMEELEYEE